MDQKQPAVTLAVDKGILGSMEPVNRAMGTAGRLNSI